MPCFTAAMMLRISTSTRASSAFATRQGANPPGGRYDYVVNGNMIAGFALIAWPADYGVSGIMTFVVNQQGKVFQKDLGKETAILAAATQEYDPDDTWTEVRE
jgi:hypothetical protein